MGLQFSNIRYKNQPSVETFAIALKTLKQG